MLRVIFALALVSTYVVAANVDVDFASFKTKFSRSYASAKDEEFRKQVFTRALGKIAQYNKELPGNHYAVTQFADWTDAEIRSILLHGAPPNMTASASDVEMLSTSSPSGLPPVPQEPKMVGALPSFYVSKYVNGVKNQGQCGSCWSFALCAVAESIWGRQQGQTGTNIPSMSPQMAVSCWARSCNGQNPLACASWWVGRMMRELTYYPYTSGSGQVRSCYTVSKGRWVKPGTVRSTTRSWGGITNQIYSKEAVSIYIIVCQDFMYWKSSSAYKCRCSSNVGAHEMAAVGWGFQGTGASAIPYVVVKNSWGTSWGVSGYVYLTSGTCNSYSNSYTGIWWQY